MTIITKTRPPFAVIHTLVIVPASSFFTYWLPVIWLFSQVSLQVERRDRGSVPGGLSAHRSTAGRCCLNGPVRKHPWPLHCIAHLYPPQSGERAVRVRLRASIHPLTNTRALALITFAILNLLTPPSLLSPYSTAASAWVFVVF